MLCQVTKLHSYVIIITFLLKRKLQQVYKYSINIVVS